MKLRYVITLLLLGWLPAAQAQTVPRPNISAPQGLAVNSYTGNLFFQRNEQSLRGTGYRIYQTFYYNAAQDTLNYGYGHGWSFYYNLFYRELTDRVIIHHADAKKDTFLLRSGSYASPAGVFDVLTKTGNQFTLTMKDGSRYEFADATHRKITRMQDANGNSVTLTYAGGNPTEITNSPGRSLLLTWTNGLLTEAKDSSDPTKKFTYIYSAARDLVAVVNPLQGRRSFVYQNHYLVRLSDENGNPVVVYYYGGGGKVKQITSCNTEQRFSYINNPRRTFVTQKAESGNVVIGYAFDAVGRLSAMTDPDGHRAEYSYDSNNNLLTEKDLRGLTTTYTYDTKGNVLTTTDPLGNQSAYTYDATFNKPTSVRDAKGRVTTMSYDSKGNLTGLTRPGNLSSTFTYDAAGRRLTAANPNSNTTAFQYNTAGDLIRIQYPVGVVNYEYNGNCCNVSKITDANGSTLEMTYDALNRPQTVKDKQGNTTRYDYDAGGNVVRETDANGNAKQYGYDDLNRLTSVTLTVGVWTYNYDGQSNLIRMTDSNGNATRYSYDKKGQLLNETDPLGKVTTYAYDAGGNLIRRTDPNGNVVTYTYDNADRLVEKTYPGNADKYSFDEVGNLVSAYNNNIAYTFEYDNLNRLLKKNIVTWNKSLAYTYDAVGNRKTMTDHDGGVTTYTYDANNRLTRLTNPANLTTTFEYDAGGRIKKQTNGNGTFATYHYDSAGRMDSLINWKNATEKISFFYYTFDQYGNRKTLRDKRGLHTYTYDSAYRLTNVAYADGSTESFTLDGSGNRTQRVKNGTTTAYTYNAAYQIQTAGPASFTFDANGNTIAQNNNRLRSYRFDGDNRLLDVVLTPQRKLQYKYDPFGAKIERIDSLGVTARMIYDNDNLLGELTVGNMTQSLYTTALGMDSWLSMQTSGNHYIFQKDGLNSTAELTRLNGSVANQYAYDSYGNSTIQMETVVNRVMYTGRLYESQSGLYDYRARFYNPELGRFLVKDKIHGALGYPLTHNEFSYAESDPANYTDPTGLRRSYIEVIGNSVNYANNLPYTIYQKVGKNKPSVTQEHRGQNDDGMASCEDIPQIFNDFANGSDKRFNDKSRYIDTDFGLVDLQHIYFSGNPMSFFGNKESGFLNLLLGGLGLGIDGGLIIEIMQSNGADNKSAWMIEDLISNHVGAGSALGALLSNRSFAEGVQGELSRMGGCKPKQPDGSKDPLPNSPNGEPIRIPTVNPSDPNEIVGPAGYDTLKWVSVKQQLPYKVLFENDPDFATAPAQNVTVYVPIHPKLNPASLRLGDFGFGSFNFSVPANTSVYSNRLDVRDSLGVFVDITAGLDFTNRRAFWIFQSIDPATGLAATLPANSGFLPVNDTTRRNGEGYVTFTLQPSALAQTRDTVTAQASIIFDSEETINTNRWVNTVDAVAPVSNIGTLATVVDSVFNVSWISNDDQNGSGIKCHILYVSKNSGPFTVYKDGLTSLSQQIVGEPGATLAFFTRATDKAGNLENEKYIGDRVVTVRLPSTSSAACVGSNFTFSTSATAGATYQWQVDTGTGFVDLSNNEFYSGVSTTQLIINQPPGTFYGYTYRSRVTVGTAISYSPVRRLKFVSTWLGIAGDSWHIPANWSCGVVPTEYIDVIIPTNVPYKPTVHSDATCNSLTMNEASAIIFKPAARLRLRGK